MEIENDLNTTTTQPQETSSGINAITELKTASTDKSREREMYVVENIFFELRKAGVDESVLQNTIDVCREYFFPNGMEAPTYLEKYRQVCGENVDIIDREGSALADWLSYEGVSSETQQWIFDWSFRMCELMLERVKEREKCNKSENCEEVKDENI